MSLSYGLGLHDWLSPIAEGHVRMPGCVRVLCLAEQHLRQIAGVSTGKHVRQFSMTSMTKRLRQLAYRVSIRVVVWHLPIVTIQDLSIAPGKQIGRAHV